MRHLIEPTDFSLAELHNLLALGQQIKQNPQAYSDVCKHKVLATCFYEPSTRTRLSFESAMLHLGGQVLGFHSSDSSSASKGETIADTVRIVGGYADICAMRHPLDGSALRASLYAKIPVINAGDGGHQHPTQTLTDLLTIQGRAGKLDHLKIGLCGDLKYGRTVHSLIAAMARYEGNEFILISPEELRVPAYVRENLLEANHIPYTEITSLEEAMPVLDVLYMTRIQRERFYDENEYLRLKDSYILTPHKMQLAKEDMSVLHPLPRVNEIALAVDEDKRAAYFEQAQNGVYARMALIMTLLGLAPDGPLPDKERECRRWQSIGGKVCRNHRCITNHEEETVPLFAPDENGTLRCVYCNVEV